MITVLAATTLLGPQLSYSTDALIGAQNLKAVADRRFGVKEVARFWVDRPCEIMSLSVAFAGQPGRGELHLWRDIDHEWPFYRFEQDLTPPFRIPISKGDLNQWRSVSLDGRHLAIRNPGYLYVGVVVKPGEPTLAIDAKLDHPETSRYEVFDTKTPRAKKAYWVRPDGDFAVKLSLRNRLPVSRLFKDATVAAGLENARGSSIAWADIDGDSWEDIILSGPRPQVFKNLDGKSFRDITAQCQLGGSASFAVLADIDNDGDQDVFLGDGSETGSDRIFLNDGKGHFKLSQDLKDNWPSKGATWLDYDLDGRVDLFVANGADGIKTHNCLWHNKGSGKFALAKINAIGAAPVAFSRSAVAADLDGDGRSEVAVGTLRLQPDQLWWINSKSAVDRAKAFRFDLARSPARKVTGGQGAGVAIADLDNDAKPDIWVANLMHPDWRGYEASVLSELFVSRGPRLLNRKSAGQVGLEFDESPADPTLGDFDNDGDVDAYIGSTYHHGDYYENVGGRFRNETYRSAIETFRGESSAACDYDHDGRLDLVATTQHGHLRLYRNIGPTRSWVELTLNKPESIGASVYLSAGGRTYLRQVICGKGLGSQDSATLHFGLGSATKVSSLRIRWPGRRGSSIEHVRLNHRLIVR